MLDTLTSSHLPLARPEPRPSAHRIRRDSLRPRLAHGR
jgi:hypothetical protein